jgi:hypothetical protein
MALYSSGTQIANVALTDTFNTWRTRFNQSINDGFSSSANNTVSTGTHVFGVGATVQFNNSITTTGITGSSAALTGPVTAPTVTANSFVGPINGNLTGTLQTAAQPNITSTGALNSGSITSGFGNIDVGSSNIDGGTITADTAFVGTLSTAAQGNITSVGALDGGSITSNFGNINVGTSSVTGGTFTTTNLDLNGNGDVSGNWTIGGNLTVNGTTTTVSSTNTVVSDNLIELNNGVASNANDSGFVIERGSTGDNAFMGWDESADKFIVGTTTATGASTGNLTITKGTIVADLEGTVTTAAQASITSLGTLTGLTMGGTLDVNGQSLTMGAGAINGEGGTYTNLHPAVTTFTTAVNFNQPLHSQQMAASRTITYSNGASGKSTIVYIDRSASNYTPTWPTTKWANDEEPTWSDYRHWVVNLYVRVDGAVCGSATGHAN